MTRSAAGFRVLHKTVRAVADSARRILSHREPAGGAGRRRCLEETAAVLEVSRATAARDLKVAKAWLGSELRDAAP